MQHNEHRTDRDHHAPRPTLRFVRGFFVGSLIIMTTMIVCGCAGNATASRSIVAPPSSPYDSSAQITATFSIVAVDPDTGEVGAAVASKYPAVGRVVPYVKAGVGAFVTQHYHNPAWGPTAIDMLGAGKTPEEVLAALLKDDNRPGKRQLAIIATDGRAAQRHCDTADKSGRWWGGMSGRFYACQGNTLTGPDVVVAMAKAYETTKGSMSDRLVAALIAGDCAGGDHRGRLAAGVKVAKKGIDGVWFELHVDKSDDAVIELAKKYVETQHDAKGAWPGGKAPFVHPCPERVAPKPANEPRP